MYQPIIIAAPGRSGTTMVAGLLNRHGVWIGEGRITSHKETNSLIVSENTKIKKKLKQMAREIGYTNRQVPLPVINQVQKRADDLFSYLSTFIPKDRKWLVKTTWTLVFGEVWKAAFPRARWIFIERNITDIISSVKRHPAMRNRDANDVYLFALALQKRQRFISSSIPENQYLFVDIDKIGHCDMEECRKILTFCEITPNDEIIRSWIKPEIWHGSKINEVC